ncbi:MAG: hypothetical protein GY913_15260, partial [Proteobacteria bacterium]|nr:hypothetical protein [Pseudomonadota bacterium]
DDITTGAVQADAELRGGFQAGDGGEVFIVYGQGRHVPYGRAKVWRADGSTMPSDPGTLDWVPMNDFSDVESDSWTTNKSERADAVDANGSWMADQEALSSYYPAGALDGLYESTDDRIYVAGDVGVFLLDAENGAGTVPGYDTSYSASGDLDLDELPWTFAYDSTADQPFQTSVATGVAWCSECSDGTGTGIGLTSVLDLGAAWIDEGAESTIDCHFETWGAQGRSVDFLYYDDEDENTPDEVAWVGFGPQDTDSDAQGVFRWNSDDEQFCYGGLDAFLSRHSGESDLIVRALADAGCVGGCSTSAGRSDGLVCA